MPNLSDSWSKARLIEPVRAGERNGLSHHLLQLSDRDDLWRLQATITVPLLSEAHYHEDVTSGRQPPRSNAALAAYGHLGAQ